jgi:hypothetical protein
MESGPDRLIEYQERQDDDRGGYSDHPL